MTLNPSCTGGTAAIMRCMAVVRYFSDHPHGLTHKRVTESTVYFAIKLNIYLIL